MPGTYLEFKKLSEWELWPNTAGAIRSVLEQSTIGANLLKSHRSHVQHHLLRWASAFLFPPHCKHTPLNHPLLQFAKPHGLLYHTLYFCISTSLPLSFRDLITRHLTNGPSVLPISQKKDQQLKARLAPVSPSLTLTWCTTQI